MNKKIATLSILGFLAVGLGAFGAHGLKPKLDTVTIHAFETAVQYHFYHVFALAFLACLRTQFEEKRFNLIFLLFLWGIILFSGSLYGISIAKAFGGSLRFLGPITPVGGVLFMLAWALIAWNFVSKEDSKD